MSPQSTAFHEVKSEAEGNGRRETDVPIKFLYQKISIGVVHASDTVPALEKFTLKRRIKHIPKVE